MCVCRRGGGGEPVEGEGIAGGGGDCRSGEGGLSEKYRSKERK